MLHNLRGDGFDCLSTLISIKMEHPRPLQVCTHVCIIFAHTGPGCLGYIVMQKKMVFIEVFL